MKEFFNNNWTIGICSSIFGGILVYLLLRYLPSWNKRLVDGLSKISKSYSNSLYKEMASGNQSNASNFIGTILIIVIFTLVGAYSSYTYGTLDGFEKEAKEQLVRMENLDKPETSKEELLKAKEELLKDIQQNLNHIKMMQIMALIFAIYLITVCIIMLIKYARILYVNNANAIFNQCLNLIRPNITEEFYLHLKQEWAFMVCREDFENILGVVDVEVKKVKELRRLN